MLYYCMLREWRLLGTKRTYGYKTTEGNQEQVFLRSCFYPSVHRPVFFSSPENDGQFKSTSYSDVYLLIPPRREYSTNGGQMNEQPMVMVSRFFRKMRLKLSHNGFLSFGIPLSCCERLMATVTFSISQCALVLYGNCTGRLEIDAIDFLFLTQWESKVLIFFSS